LNTAIMVIRWRNFNLKRYYWRAKGADHLCISEKIFFWLAWCSL
jgi:hypothetical protein